MTSTPHIQAYDSVTLQDALDLLIVRGQIYARDKCPLHQVHFRGKACQVAGCTEHPRGPFRVELKWKGRKVKISSGKKGNVFYALEDALKVLVEINRELDADPPRFDPDAYNQNRGRTHSAYLFRTYAEKCIDAKEKGVEHEQAARSTVRMQRLYLTRHIYPEIGDTDIREITKATLKDLRAKLLEKEAHQGAGAKLSAKYVWNLINFVVSILREAEGDGMRGPAPKVKVRFKHRKHAPTLSHDEQIRVLRDIQTEEPDHAPIFWTLYFTGHRPAEVAALRIRDYLRAERMLDFRRTFSDDEIKEGRKSDEEHLLPIPDALCEILDRMLEARYSETVAPHPDALLFVPPRRTRGRPSGDHYRNNTMPRIWQRACERTGIAYIGLYESVKHSLGRRMVELGMSRPQVAELLGITEPSTRFYAQIEAEALRPLVDQLHGAPKGPLEGKRDA